MPLSYLMYQCCLSNSHNVLEIYMADESEEAYLQEKTAEVIRATGGHAYSWNVPFGFYLLWIKGCRNKQVDESDGDNYKTLAAARQPHTSYPREHHTKGTDFPY